MSKELFMLVEKLIEDTSYSYEEVCQGIRGMSSIGLNYTEVELMVEEFLHCTN